MTDQKKTDEDEARQNQKRVLILFGGTFIAFVVIALLYIEFFPQVMDPYRESRAYQKCDQQFKKARECVSQFESKSKKPKFSNFYSENFIKSLTGQPKQEPPIPPQCTPLWGEVRQCMERELGSAAYNRWLDRE